MEVLEMKINYNTYLMYNIKINIVLRVEKYTKETLRNRFKQVNRILNDYKIKLMNYILNNEYYFYSFESLNWWINLYEIKYCVILDHILYNENYLKELKNNWKC